MDKRLQQECKDGCVPCSHVLDEASFHYSKALCKTCYQARYDGVGERPDEPTTVQANSPPASIKQAWRHVIPPRVKIRTSKGRTQISANEASIGTPSSDASSSSQALPNSTRLPPSFSSSPSPPLSETITAPSNGPAPHSYPGSDPSSLPISTIAPANIPSPHTRTPSSPEDIILPSNRSTPSLVGTVMADSPRSASDQMFMTALETLTRRPATKDPSPPTRGPSPPPILNASMGNRMQACLHTLIAAQKVQRALELIHDVVKLAHDYHPTLSLAGLASIIVFLKSTTARTTRSGWLLSLLTALIVLLFAIVIAYSPSKVQSEPTLVISEKEKEKPVLKSPFEIHKAFYEHYELAFNPFEDKLAQTFFQGNESDPSYMYFSSRFPVESLHKSSTYLFFGGRGSGKSTIKMVIESKLREKQRTGTRPDLIVDVFAEYDGLQRYLADFNRSISLRLSKRQLGSNKWDHIFEENWKLDDFVDMIISAALDMIISDFSLDDFPPIYQHLQLDLCYLAHLYHWGHESLLIPLGCEVPPHHNTYGLSSPLTAFCIVAYSCLVFVETLLISDLFLDKKNHLPSSMIVMLILCLFVLIALPFIYFKPVIEGCFWLSIFIYLFNLVIFCRSNYWRGTTDDFRGVQMVLGGIVLFVGISFLLSLSGEPPSPFESHVRVVLLDEGRLDKAAKFVDSHRDKEWPHDALGCFAQLERVVHSLGWQRMVVLADGFDEAELVDQSYPKVLPHLIQSACDNALFSITTNKHDRSTALYIFFPMPMEFLRLDANRGRFDRYHVTNLVWSPQELQAIVHRRFEWAQQCSHQNASNMYRQAKQHLEPCRHSFHDLISLIPKARLDELLSPLTVPRQALEAFNQVLQKVEVREAYETEHSFLATGDDLNKAVLATQQMWKEITLDRHPSIQPTEQSEQK